MRIDTAHRYADISKSQFLRWIDQGLIRDGHKIGGIKFWYQPELLTDLDALGHSDENTDISIERALDGL